MSRFLLILARFTMIVIGYFGASVTASLFMNVAIAGFTDFTFTDVADVADTGLLLSVAAGSLFIGYFAFIPAMAAIIIGEITGKRDWLFYAIGGAVCGAVVVTLFWVGDAESALEPAYALTVVAAGIAGSWVYWLIAGRNAGSWRRRPTSSRPSGS